ncbi:MAG: cyclase family protein [Actinobacteria bacterium]|nr:cyclase family protein [Actinomycetota bacterium]
MSGIRWSEALASIPSNAEAVDLSWSLEVGGPVFPGQPGFEFEQLGRVSDEEIPLCYARIAFMEHVGTHMDAPSHAIEDGRFVDEIPFPDLVGPALKLDLREACDDLADYQVGVPELEAFERRHGHIPAGAVVLLQTGWEARYPTPERYVVADEGGGFHWPGVGAAAAQMLAERGVRGVGIDSIGLDAGHVALELDAHRAVLGSDAFILENLTRLDEVPPTGSVLLAAPIKTRFGSGGPTRVFALR